MLIRLSRNAYVRQYGPYTYVFERVDAFDKIYKDAEVFFRWITREAIEIEELLRKICDVYPDVDSCEIKNDFAEFLNPLIADHVIVAGRNLADLESNDRTFTYRSESPRTMNMGESKPRESQNCVRENLDEYFEHHPAVFNLQIDITDACTERCVHCYMPEYEPVFLPLERIEKVIEEARDAGVLQLSLSGGECMLHPNFKEIIKAARKNDLAISILSNLTLCNSEIVKLLKENDVAVQVSLYSTSEHVHDTITRLGGSFRKTMDAIEMLHEADVPCFISCPLMKQNATDYLKVLAFARSLKMDALTDFVIMGKKKR